mmetsp:Transcript_68406/g.101598  ORF Transcript_68406/g.101598 Transcript_68406/m.101598 type:complete len:95 (+) Transcript_68406:142-426(+)
MKRRIVGSTMVSSSACRKTTLCSYALSFWKIPHSTRDCVFFKELVETVHSPLGDVMATDIYLLMQSLSFNVKLTNTLIATTDAYGFRITQNWKS